MVTGANAGVGRDVAARLAADGHRVLVNDLDPVALHELAHEIGAIAAPGDDDVVALANEWLGGVDVWIGTSESVADRGLDASDDDWGDMWTGAVMAHVGVAADLVAQWTTAGGGTLVVIPPVGGVPADVAAGAAAAFTRWITDSHSESGIVAHTIASTGQAAVDEVAALV
ncbi:hypothetical protein nbrc107696_12650 [Gordonia spumicola]|uniref:Short-chain dehydrogenase n=1 Tax=Gordonia spumicola TaxID=589161 RepID=A0A7I9V5X4_9ACTN|nr:hypothetical protein nbrc107696_12650 [Gordonia spumicola]